MDAAAAMPVPRFHTQAAEDGDQEAAHQDVVGDGQGRHDVLGAAMAIRIATMPRPRTQ